MLSSLTFAHYGDSRQFHAPAVLVPQKGPQLPTEQEIWCLHVAYIQGTLKPTPNTLLKFHS